MQILSRWNPVWKLGKLIETEFLTCWMLTINHAICLHFPQAKIGNVTSIAVSKLHTHSRYLTILRMIVNFHSNKRRPTTNKIETENNQHAVQYTITYVLTNECFSHWTTVIVFRLLYAKVCEEFSHLIWKLEIHFSFRLCDSSSSVGF